MPQQQPHDPDYQVEQTIGNLLRYGVLLAAAVVLTGGVMYLFQYGGQVRLHREFQLEAEDMRTPAGIVEHARSFESRGLIQLGLLLLIATPVARVLFSVYAFARQRDWLYVVLTLVVLAVLLFSLFYGHGEGPER
jgi:uncharacterized membrane protein